MLKRLKNLHKIRYYGDWPKVKPGEILVVPSDNRLLEFPPYQNESGWPDWFKNEELLEPGTINSCKGIEEYLSLGLTVPLWCDVRVGPMGTDDVMAETSDNAFRVEGFPYRSTRGCPINEDRDRPKAHWPKIVNPFLFKTAPGYSMLCLPVAYEPDPRYEVLPAVVHTDYYHNMHVVLRVMTDETFVIEAGTPIYHIIPFKRSDKVKHIVLGDSVMHNDGVRRGMEHGSLNRFTRKGQYRKHQRVTDAEL